MAFRIQDSLVRGEIDNRTKGLVRGKIWLAGRPEPLRLELAGNAHPDLAGCRLTFQNPAVPVADPHADALDVVQRGTAGDLTASRKVRVFEVPLEVALAMFRRKEKPPERLANGLYLEWFSEANGRVVIEATDFQLVLSPPEWRMTPEENEERARQAAAGMAGFLAQLTEALEAEPDPPTPADALKSGLFLREDDTSARIEDWADSDQPAADETPKTDRDNPRANEPPPPNSGRSGAAPS